VIDTFRWVLEHRREIDALEFTRSGERVVVGARGKNVGPAEEPIGQTFNVFTLRDGRIMRIDDYRSRGEAFRAAGVEEIEWGLGRIARLRVRAELGSPRRALELAAELRVFGVFDTPGFERLARDVGIAQRLAPPP